MKQRKVRRAAASPAVVFALLLALVAAVVVAALLLTEGADEPAASTTPTGTPQPTPDHTLTDAEAIARFKELDALRIQAFESRSFNILQDVFVASGTEHRRARRTIARLRRDDVVMIHRPYRNRSLSVVDRLDHQIEIEQKVVFHIIFKGETGQDVTQRGSPELLTVRWILKNADAKWLIQSGEVVAAESYRSK